MALINRAGQEISAKVVYYGPGLSGKTTNLELLFKQVPEDQRGKMISMKTRTDRTLFFDLLPFNAEPIMDHHVRILLYTVPGQVYYNATRRLVLKGVDALVFVADSQRSKLQENLESLENLRANLADMGLKLENLPWVIQYNKRDLHDILSIPELEQALNPAGVPNFTAVAPRGEGVHSTLRGVIQHLEPSLRDLVKQEVGTGFDAGAAPTPGEEISLDGPSLDPPRSAPSRQPAANDLESFHPDAAPAFPVPSSVRQAGPVESAPAAPAPGAAPAGLAPPPGLRPLPSAPAAPPPTDEPLIPDSPSVDSLDPPPESGISHPLIGTHPGDPGVSLSDDRPAADLSAPKAAERGEFDLGPLDLDSLPDPLVVELPVRGRTGSERAAGHSPRVSPENRHPDQGMKHPLGEQREGGPAAEGAAPAEPPFGGELIVQVPRRLLETGELRLRLVIAPEKPAARPERQGELLGQD